ncbi:MAG: hypothetical protein K2L07_16290 [Lachnospiraceae bacterium]|nr:hypothetical protein [Lachnospiraceae bacterium]
MESRGICPRSTLAIDYWDEFIQERCAEWKGYSMKEQIINTYIPKDK